jgi:tripartite ATP-independent transporter DctP family solute receptor
MMLKKFRCLALVMVLILVAVSCTTFAARKPIKLTYGTSTNDVEAITQGDRYFKKLVEKKSKGKIIIDYYNNSQLGSNAEMLQATMAGSQQIAIASPGTLASLWKEMGSLDLPYLYRDQDHFVKVTRKLSSVVNTDEMAAKSGIRILGAEIRLPRQLTSTFPINKFKDIKGLKIRVPQNPSYLALWKTLGAAPTVLPWSETQTALASGVIDAQENPIDGMESSKLYEQTKYVAMTSHIRDMFIRIINEKAWKGLTASQRKIIQNATDKSNKFVNQLLIKNEKGYVKSLRKLGVVFTYPDVAPFREKAKTIWSRFGDPKIIKKIQAIK